MDLLSRDLKARLDLFDDLIEIRELASGGLGVDVLTVDAHFEDAARPRYELNRPDLLFKNQELFRQTDGFGLVVSHRAIFDGDFEFHNVEEPTLQRTGSQWEGLGRRWRRHYPNFIRRLRRGRWRRPNRSAVTRLKPSAKWKRLQRRFWA